MLEEGDFKGAIRLACSDDRWPPSTPPLSLLCRSSTQPPPNPDTAIPRIANL